MAETVISARPMSTLVMFGTSDRGLVRKNNEDNWFQDEAAGLAVVADGMGGAQCGEVASAITIEALAERLRQPGPGSPTERLEEAIREANRRVWERAQAETACQGMGSTVVIALFRPPLLYIANVGDSRAYLWRGGSLAQLSYDQTLVNDLRMKFGLTEDEVRNFPHKNVLTQAVGTSLELSIRSHQQELAPGDQVLLCSDGLSGPVSDAAIAGVLAGPDPVDAKVGQLLGLAHANGAPDNVTLILAQYQ